MNFHVLYHCKHIENMIFIPFPIHSLSVHFETYPPFGNSLSAGQFPSSEELVHSDHVVSHL